ncbi:MAG: xanthine dehydrogenase family protein subunit M [Alphaproteobacteria bacterium]
MYAKFDLVRPRTLEELLAVYSGAGPSQTVLAGGTVALVDIRAGRLRPDTVFSIDRLDGLRGISWQGRSISIGARTTVSDLLESPKIEANAPSLAQAAAAFAGLMVRNSATIAGNIACGSPAADLVPPLLSLDAEIALTSAGGTRHVALADYHLGYKKDVRRPGEVITRITLPDLDEGDFNAFYKLARRRGDAITVVGAAVTVRRSGGLCRKVRIALGSVSPAPMRAEKAEALLEGAGLAPDLVEAAAEAAERECSPIDDVRATAAYRRKMVRVLVRRLLAQAAERLS